MNHASYDARMCGARRVSGYLLALLLIFAIAGCADESPPNPATAQPRDAGPRLVTLAPALSQMIVDLGLSDAIVGVAEHDTAAPPGLPIIGNYNAVNTEMLLSARPTHVLMMVGPGGPPARLSEMAGQGLFQLHTFPFPLSIADIGRVLYNEMPQKDESPSLGGALGVPQAALALKLRMLRQLAAIGSLTAPLDEPSVLLVIGSDPVMACGPRTVHDQLLAFAGGLNAAADATVTAPEYDRESLLALAPQVILFLQPNAPALKDDDPRLAPFAGLPIPAIQTGRVHVINDPLVLLPSTSITRVCAEMAKAIHPQLTEQIDRVMADQDQALSLTAGGSP